MVGGGGSQYYIFHRKASRRRQQNLISQLCGEDGVVVNSEVGIHETVVGFFQDLFCIIGERELDMEDIVLSRVTERDKT